MTPLLHSIPFQPKPWYTEALEIKRATCEASRWRYFIVAYDLHFKWPDVRAVYTFTSSALIRCLKELFSRWGLPIKVITYNGKQFVSHQIEEFKWLGIEHANKRSTTRWQTVLSSDSTVF